MDKVRIGKDVIESLTLGMYEDSRFIYREYVQNSADQIDKAVELGVLKIRDEGNIFISIESDERRIIIEDNATGIEADKVVDILRNIAQSTKDRSKDKGFRGIGRLGGLGYCEKLIFETSYKNEKMKSIMAWDARKLKNIINDRTQKEEATEVIRNITTFTQENEDATKHYFKVILENVENKELLDVDGIREYMSMIAPVPFEGHFVYKNKIIDELKKNEFCIDEYKIFINTDQLYKAYRSTIKDNNGKNKDELFDVKFKVIKSGEASIGFIWYGISKSIEQIPAKNNPARGFRLRKGNIQIGNEFTLRKLHKDARFHFYFLGEVHAFSPDLIPNARRDYFLENKLCKDFEDEMKLFFSNDIHKLTYAASNINSANRKVEQFEQVKRNFEDTQKKGFTSREEKQKLEQQLTETKQKAEQAKKELQKHKEKYKDNPVLRKIYNKVVTTETIEPEEADISDECNNGKTKYRTDNLSKLSKSERKLVSRIYKIIDDKLTPDLSENLKYWIEEEFK